MTSRNYLALDLGAESGRAILGKLELAPGSVGAGAARRISLEEVHRFNNVPAHVQGHLYWDVLYLWNEILNGVRAAVRQSDGGIASLGVDTWGVDFGLLDQRGNLLGNPYHYRDWRTNGMLEAAFQVLPRQEIYEQTGNQFLQLNSLFQLLAMKHLGDPTLGIAQTFLNIPDLFNYWLTGRKANEFTISTTTQCFNPRKRRWAYELLERLDLPTQLFGEILPPGSIYGEVKPEITAELKLPTLRVAAIGSHDTASAVAAVPAQTPRFVFISSGTWSLLGAELDEPLISAQSLECNFTNEGGIGGKTRFLKNLSGMWLVQECRRVWAAEGKPYSYSELTELAAGVEPFRSLLDPNDPVFLQPGEMPNRIREYFQKRGQPVPENPGDFVRSALESLAMVYRQVIDQLAGILGYRAEMIHIVGGGSRNHLLNQFTADATGIPVTAGPVEATAMGNILMQAMALGDLNTLEEARQLVRESVHLDCYEPQSTPIWDEKYADWLRLVSNNCV